MIDLHLHTNASDGRFSPRDLVARAAAAGLSIISVVDHDTFAAQSEVAAEAERAGLRTIVGIEITAVWQGLDVHVLGYYLDPASPSLARFLEEQRADRVRRVHEMIARLAALGARIDFRDVVSSADERAMHSIGRPLVARALLTRGYVANMSEAFDRYLADGRPAFVPRIGATPDEVTRLIVAGGGIASLAHPGLLRHDELIPGMAAAGMQAIEVYYPDHPPATVTHYETIAERHGLVPTGGSDYHAAESDAVLGHVTLPPEQFERLEALASE